MPTATPNAEVALTPTALPASIDRVPVWWGDWGGVAIWLITIFFFLMGVFWKQLARPYKWYAQPLTVPELAVEKLYTKTEWL